MHAPPSSNSSIPGYCYFYVEQLYMTRTRGVFQLDGALVFEGTTTVGRERKRASFALSGFWSETTGQLCMVGSDWHQYNSQGCPPGSACIRVSQGNALVKSVVFKLNYPKISDISTSLVNGTVESLDSVSNPNYFDPISVLAYAQLNYSYTMIAHARESCSTVTIPADSLGIAADVDICSHLSSLFHTRFRLEYEIGSLSDKNLGFSSTFMKFNRFQCSENGELHMFIRFYSGGGHDHILIPEESLVAEGVWDGEKQKLCVLACRILNTQESAADGYVDDCSFRMSVWFPSVFSLRNRSIALGKIWSNKGKNDPGYFRMISFRSLGTRLDLLSGWRYEYDTELDAVTKYSCSKDNVPSLHSIRYPDRNSLNDMQFDIALENVEGNKMVGFATLLTFGEMNIYSNSYRVFDIPEVNLSIFGETKNWSVGYMINMHKSCGCMEDFTDISAEGIYDAETGRLCMRGCPHPSISETDDSKDCEVLIDVQLPPKNPEHGECLTGTGEISSTREKSDPLYFEPLEISTTCKNTDRQQSIESIQRVDVVDAELVMVLISRTLSCIFIVVQLFHVKKHQDVQPSISITSLSILAVGYMIPLLLNYFKALFIVNRNNLKVLSRSRRWAEVNEVTVQDMTLLAFLLQCCLLQSAWSSRSKGESSRALWIAERKTLKFCLPLYFTGALIASFVHCRSYEAQMKSSDFNAGHSRSPWEDLISYSGLILDGFLLPQIILNTFSKSKGQVLNPLFYIGMVAVQVLPPVYDAYRARHHLPRFSSSHTYPSPEGKLYSLAWDIIIPLPGFLFALLVYLQQRFGGSCLLPQKFKIAGGDEMVPLVRDSSS